MKDVIKVLVLTIVLTIISAIIITVYGDTYSAVLDHVKEDYIISVENDTGKIAIANHDYVDETLYVKIKAIEPGNSYLKVTYSDYQTMQMYYIHKNMVITDNNFFGKSTYSEVIPISMVIIITYILFLITKRYRHSVKENIFQYRNVGYLAIFIFLLGFDLQIGLSLFNYQGIYDSISKIISSFSSMSFLLLPIAIITFGLVTISNIRLIRKEGLSVKNLLGLILGLFLCFCTLLPDFVYEKLQVSQKINIFNLNSPGPYIYNFFESIIYMTTSYLECVLIATIIVSLKSVRRKHEYNKDYIIILGCQIKKDGTLTPLLKGRVDKAIEFRNKQLEETKKDLVFIPSGGKGQDEKISEALAIKNYLIEYGISPKNIIMDDKSTNTYENIKFSNKLIKKKNSNVLFSTTNYHVFRAGLIATSQGLVLDGIGSRTKAYFWINAFIREFIGTLYSEKKKHIIMFGLMIISLIVMIYITYLANNL